MFSRVIRKCGINPAVVVTVCAALLLAAAIIPSVADRSFNPKTYKGKMGKITVQYSGESSLNVRDVKTRNVLVLSTKNGVFQAPVGTYELLSYFGKSGAWYFYCSSPLGGGKRITTKPNGNQKLNLGPPFTASVDVRPLNNNQVSMDFNLKSQNGDVYIMRKDAGDPPGFQVLDSNKKVIWSGSFRYG